MHAHSMASLFRIIVEIDGKRIMVPVKPETTVNELRDLVSARCTGLPEPAKLTGNLMTHKHSALLGNEDKLCEVCEDGEILVFDLPAKAISRPQSRGFEPPTLTPSPHMLLHQPKEQEQVPQALASAAQNAKQPCSAPRVTPLPYSDRMEHNVPPSRARAPLPPPAQSLMQEEEKQQQQRTEQLSQKLGIDSQEEPQEEVDGIRAPCVQEL